jgi:hypothetical protein
MRSSIFLLLAFSSCALGNDLSWIDQSARESAAANESCKAREYAACRDHLLQLRDLLDGRADVVYRLAKVEAALGHRAAALEALAVFADTGLTFADPASEPEFAPLHGEPRFRDALTKIAAARKPVSSSRIFTTLPENDLIAEDIAYDSVNRQFYVSSVRHRKILAVGMDGRAHDFIAESQPNIWAILALGVDARRRLLWASTAAMAEGLGYTAADEGRSALLKYSLDSHALIKRYDLPRDAAHALGDMTLTSAGDVFVSDGQGAVYWVDHAKDTIDLLVGPGTFRSPQTPALTPDGARLFVPDYTRGIGIVDLGTNHISLLGHAASLSLAGIDGLYLSGTNMIAIQNGTGPERLIRMRLDRDLTRVTNWETLEANWAGLGDPTHGVVVDGEFYFIANSGWDVLGANGALQPGKTFTVPSIRRLAFDPGQAAR